MLDINLVHRNDCYSFTVSKHIREVLFHLRKVVRTVQMIPNMVEITVKKPIINMFDGAIKTMPIGFGIYNTEHDAEGKEMRTAIILNYYGGSITNKIIEMPHKMYARTILGQMNIAAASCAGINMLTIVGNDGESPLILDTRSNTEDVINAINLSEKQVEIYIAKYKVTKHYDINPGMQCMLCERRDKCL